MRELQVVFNDGQSRIIKGIPDSVTVESIHDLFTKRCSFLAFKCGAGTSCDVIIRLENVSLFCIVEYDPKAPRI